MWLCGLRWGCLLTSFLVVAGAQAREWKDVSGEYAIEAELFGFDDENVVLQRADGELGMLSREELSQPDREYLHSPSAESIRQKNLGGMQTWTTEGGVQLVGRVVDFARGEITVQRRRGRMYVNDRAFANLPEFYRRLLPRIVEHFDEVEIPDERALQNWLLSLRGRPRTFALEGVTLELENGDEHLVPFFLLAAQDRNVLKAGWANWLAAQDDRDRLDDLAFRLEALAAAYFQNQQINRQVALMDLNLRAIRAGLTAAWEVTLYPLPGNPSPPRWVVMLGRDSAQATEAALIANPGFFAGAVRRVSR